LVNPNLARFFAAGVDDRGKGWDVPDVAVVEEVEGRLWARVVLVVRAAVVGEVVLVVGEVVLVGAEGAEGALVAAGAAGRSAAQAVAGATPHKAATAIADDRRADEPTMSSVKRYETASKVTRAGGELPHRYRRISA
jgi:hypothetical protein